MPELVLVEPQVQRDERGFFMETYKRSAFEESGISATFVQENHSRSERGVLRGLHYQNPPAAQAKLVRVIAGEIFDVAVDIRKGSPTYGGWIGTGLSAENRRMLYVPEGFAHGFLAMSDDAEVLYKTTAEYSPDHEAGIAWNDPGIEIAWPVKEPLLSPRDAAWPGLSRADNGFVYGGEW